MKVIHAVPRGTKAYACHSLETGEDAIVVTTPIKLGPRERWSFLRQRVVRLRWNRADIAAARHLHSR